MLHLVNTGYDPASDSIRPVEKAQVFVPQMLADPPSRCTLFAPGSAPTELSFVRSRSGVWINVPRTGVWSVIKLDP